MYSNVCAINSGSALAETGALASRSHRPIYRVPRKESIVSDVVDVMVMDGELRLVSIGDVW